jgi:hypothetical protein
VDLLGAGIRRRLSVGPCWGGMGLLHRALSARVPALVSQRQALLVALQRLQYALHPIRNFCNGTLPCVGFVCSVLCVACRAYPVRQPASAFLQHALHSSHFFATALCGCNGLQTFTNSDATALARAPPCRYTPLPCSPSPVQHYPSFLSLLPVESLSRARALSPNPTPPPPSISLSFSLPLSLFLSLPLSLYPSLRSLPAVEG